MHIRRAPANGEIMKSWNEFPLYRNANICERVSQKLIKMPQYMKQTANIKQQVMETMKTTLLSHIKKSLKTLNFKEMVLLQNAVGVNLYSETF
jgi:hypothetical protein